MKGLSPSSSKYIYTQKWINKLQLTNLLINIEQSTFWRDSMCCTRLLFLRKENTLKQQIKTKKNFEVVHDRLWWNVHFGWWDLVSSILLTRLGVIHEYFRRFMSKLLHDRIKYGNMWLQNNPSQLQGYTTKYFHNK